MSRYAQHYPHIQPSPLSEGRATVPPSPTRMNWANVSLEEPRSLWRRAVAILAPAAVLAIAGGAAVLTAQKNDAGVALRNASPVVLHCVDRLTGQDVSVTRADVQAVPNAVALARKTFGCGSH